MVRTSNTTETYANKLFVDGAVKSEIVRNKKLAKKNNTNKLLENLRNKKYIHLLYMILGMLI